MRKENIDNMRVLGWDMKTFGICNDSYMFSKCIFQKRFSSICRTVCSLYSGKLFR